MVRNNLLITLRPQQHTVKPPAAIGGRVGEGEGQGGGTVRGQRRPVQEVGRSEDDVIRAVGAGDGQTEKTVGEAEGAEAWLGRLGDGDVETLRGAQCGQATVTDNHADQISGRRLGNDWPPGEDAADRVNHRSRRGGGQGEGERLRGNIGVRGGVGESDGLAGDERAVGDGGEGGRAVGALLGMTKDADGYWYVDGGKTGGSAIVQVVGLPMGPGLNSLVNFVFLTTAIQVA